MRPLENFVEMMPYVVGVAYLLAAVTLVAVLARPRSFRGWELALLAGLTLLANVAVRCLADWTLVMLALGVPQLRDLLAEAAQTARRRFGVRLVLRADRFCRRLMDSPLLR